MATMWGRIAGPVIRAGSGIMLHFDQIQAAALAQADQLLIEWFPNGRQVGREFKVGNLAGEPGQSLSINLDTGLWSDFAVGVGGRDLIDLYAKLRHGGDRVPAARALTDMLGIRDDAELRADDIRHNGNESFSNEWLPMAPPPGTLRPDDALAEFDVVYEYTDAADRVTHYVGRIEARNGRRKQFVPITFGTFGGATGWHKKAPAIPRPLYGLNRLATKPEAAVILCEGEKAADAAQAMFLDHACVSWFGGTGSVDHADLASLEGRDVVIWPDNDKPGHEAALKLAKRLPHARVLRVDDLPDGADAADVAPDDPDAWLAERLSPVPASGRRNLLPVHTFGALLDDDSPMPDDILAPRVLTPGGILVIGGAPKVGKSDLLINLLVHAAAGAPFLCFTPPRPLRIIYLQAEIQYHYLRERLQGLKLDPQLIASARDNLAVTPKLRMLLNDDGLTHDCRHPTAIP